MTAPRDEIVAALATVPGIQALASTPDTIHAGHAWPLWQSTEYTTHCVALEEWAVRVALPASASAETSEQADDWRHVIALVLQPLGRIVQVRPASQGGDRSSPAMEFVLEISVAVETDG